METIGIIGAGAMGTDIAQISSQANYNVLLYDIDHNQLEDAYEKIKTRLTKYIENEKIKKEDGDLILSNLSLKNKISEMKSVDLIIECITEDVKLKKDLFKELDQICNPATILASNTSSISITEIGSATKRPESVIGLHFINPARIMKLVEIIPGLLTTRETVEMAKHFLKKLGKEFVEAKDYPGFSLNRMLFLMINEAIFLLYEGAGTVESIDKTLKLGLNVKMGPLELADMIGLDIVYAVGEEMFRGYHDQKYRPCPLLKKYVSAGYLGKKSGRGFYIY